MRSSVIAALSIAGLAMAKPVDLDKRALEIEWVTDYVVVYVPANADAAAPAAQTEPPAPVVPAPAPEVPAPAPAPAPAPVQQQPAPAPAPVQQQPAPAAPAAAPAAADNVVVITVPAPNVDLPVQQQPNPQPNPEPQPAGGSQNYPITPPAPGDLPGTVIYNHMLHRDNHTCGAITYSEKLAEYAQKAVDTCHFAHMMGVDGASYGQNIAAWGTTGDVASLGAAGAAAKAITDQWYNSEFMIYEPFFGGEPDMGEFELFGHLSQILWAGTKQVGCAVKLCPPNTVVGGMAGWYTVCNYFPPGNMGGQYAQNVKPPTGAPVVVI